MREKEREIHISSSLMNISRLFAPHVLTVSVITHTYSPPPPSSHYCALFIFILLQYIAQYLYLCMCENNLDVGFLDCAKVQMKVSSSMFSTSVRVKWRG